MYLEEVERGDGDGDGEREEKGGVGFILFIIFFIVLI